MHEYSIVEDMMKQLCTQLQEKGVSKVTGIRMRRESTFSQGALEQAFEMLSPNTPLEGATLEIEETVIENTCAKCGYEDTIDNDDLVGHYYICPNCGESMLVDEHHGLEILEVKTG